MGLKILLITPPYHCGILEIAGRWTPVNYVYLAGELRRAGHEPVIYDAMTLNHDLTQIVERVHREQPDLVGLTAFTPAYPAAIEVLTAVKRLDPKITTVFGGIHPTLLYAEVLTRHAAAVDYVIRGEGERTIIELADCLNAQEDAAAIPGLAFLRDGKLVVTPKRTQMTSSELDQLQPAWDLLNWADYTYFMIPGSTLAVLSSSRGCSEECGFCSQQKFWERQWRGRSPQNVVAEIARLNADFGVNVFMFGDEFPTKDRARWEEILDGIIALQRPIYILMETRVEDIVRDADIMYKYKQAGVIHIYVGVEAASQDGLDRFKKNIKVEESKEALRILRQAGIISETSFILGTPEETKQSIARTLAQAIEYDPDFAHFLMLAPWPYADMYAELKPHIVSFDYSQYNLVTPVIKPERLSIKELEQEMLNCYRQFYLQKLPKWEAMSDDFNRRYLINSLRKMLSSSFLKAHFAGAGKIPAPVQKYIQKLAVS